MALYLIPHASVVEPREDVPNFQGISVRFH